MTNNNQKNLSRELRVIAQMKIRMCTCVHARLSNVTSMKVREKRFFLVYQNHIAFQLDSWA